VKVVGRVNIGHAVWSGHLLVIVPRHALHFESNRSPTAVLFRACLDIQGPRAKRTLLYQGKEDWH